MTENELLKELKNMSILYVEDEIDVQNALVSIIKRRNDNLIVASNGLEGYEKYLEFIPDLIITDIKMPVMDGLEMSKKIREHSKTVPIIITTAFNNTDFLLDAIDIGVNQFVLKPIDSKKLFSAILHCVREISYEARLEKSNIELLKNVKMLTEYKNAVEASSIASITDPNGVITEVNNEFCLFTGYSREELIGKTHEIIRSKDENFDSLKRIEDAKNNKEIFKGLLKGIKKSGEDFYVNLTIVPILDKDNNVVEYVELRNNVTGLIKQIYTDPLTGYPNRAALSKKITQVENPLLFIINLDSFKDINDFYGNAAGDELLIVVTNFLGAYIKENYQGSLLYKLSSDEFAVLLNDKEVQERRSFAKKINSLMEKHAFYINETDVNISATIGYSSTKKNIIANADMALKYAKANHIDNISFEDVSFVLNGHEKNLTCTKKLKRAISENNIIAYFQPIIDNKTGEIVKYESLMRMVEDDAIISPIYFLNTAVKAKQYHKLTKIMIDRIFDVFKDSRYDFSLNISASDILRVDTKEYLLNKIGEYGIANRFIIEILESEDFEKYDEIKNFIHEIKSLGCRVAIDDFGSGYSNFQHLINLNVDFIKIDGSLIKDIVDDKNSQIVTQTIADFAKKLGIKTVAEFVHSEAVQKIILEMGIDYSQGYYFSEPKPDII